MSEPPLELYVVVNAVTGAYCSTHELASSAHEMIEMWTPPLKVVCTGIAYRVVTYVPAELP
jgi:hypothetical protein